MCYSKNDYFIAPKTLQIASHISLAADRKPLQNGIIAYLLYPPQLAEC